LAYDAYRKIIEIQLLRQKLNNVLGKDVTTTEEEVHARHILVKTFDDAQKVEARLKAGEDFAQVASDVSQDTSNKDKGGDLGWFGHGQMVKPFEDAAFSLPVLQVSDPVTSTFGVHIIQVLEKDPTHPLDAQRLQQKRSQALADWLQKTHSDPNTKIERFFSTDYIPGDIRRLLAPPTPVV
jgi:foldase protein PrsA